MLDKTLVKEYKKLKTVDWTPEWYLPIVLQFYPVDYLWENRMLEAKQENIVVLSYKGDWVSGVVLLGSLYSL